MINNLYCELLIIFKKILKFNLEIRDKNKSKEIGIKKMKYIYIYIYKKRVV